MNDLEERLRADLLGATELIDAEPDLDAVVREGDLVLRGRFVRRVAGGVAVALVVGLVTWVATVPRALPGVPAPLATPSASPLTSESASIDLRDAGVNRSAPPARAVDVSATRVGTGYSVSFTITAADGSQRRFSGELEAGRALFRQYPRLMVGVVADRVTWRDSAYGYLVGGMSGMERAMPGLGLTLVVDVAEKPGNTIRGLIWQGSDGLVHDDAGNELPSTTVGVAGQAGVVYLSDRLDTFGYREVDGPTAVRTDIAPDSELVKIAVRHGADATEHAGLSLAVGLLPEGASDPRPTLAGYGRGWSSASLSGTGRVVFVAVGQDLTGGKGALVTKVVYTGADGRRVAYRPS